VFGNQPWIVRISLSVILDILVEVGCGVIPVDQIGLVSVDEHGHLCEDLHVFVQLEVG